MLKVNIVKACDEIYGKKNAEKWPGKFRTNLNEYANACFGSCARLHNFQSNSQVLSSKEGKLCQRAMVGQLKANGKTPCANWLPTPVISLPPRVSFFNEIKKGLNTGDARDKCLRACTTDECKDNAYFDYKAYILANPLLPLVSPSPSPPILKRRGNHKKKHIEKLCDYSHDLAMVFILIFGTILLIIFMLFYNNYHK
jgi:hypothetical protein